MKKLLISGSHDPYFNVASEKYLFDHFTDETLFFWRNDPCVVIGRNQNSWLECDSLYMEEHGIRLVRRYTGGGAVYQDPGNLNYSWFTHEKGIEPLLGWLTAGLQELGIRSITGSRNDLLAEGRKFSGTASMSAAGRYLYHGTLMISVDRQNLSGALKPSRLKMKSHGIDSVRSRVINLQELSPQITAEQIITAVSAQYGPYEAGSLPALDVIRRLRDELADPGWLINETPAFETTLEYRLKDGIWQVRLDVREGIVHQAEVYTDSLKIHDTKAIAQRLQELPFDETEIRRILEEYADR